MVHQVLLIMFQNISLMVIIYWYQRTEQIFWQEVRRLRFQFREKTWVNNHAHVLKFTSYELRKYVENYLNSIDLSKYISGGAQPKLNQDNLNKITIPIPNIERVKYVVSILDRFDTLCNDLSTGLPAEIETRQKQYEYYRDKLLSFEKIQK